jgi:outer membrane protein assembly factor BamB
MALPAPSRWFFPVVLCVLCVLGVPSLPARAGDWPGWRGPTGQGVTDEKDLPQTWTGKTGANVLWKVPLKGIGQSSPIVWRERVIVTTVFWPAGRAQTEYPEHHVTCYQAGDGKLLWDTLIEPGPWLLKDLRGGYCAPTPATDGERVYVLFGSAVLAAVDLDGKLLWRRDIPPPRSFDVAISSSPVLYTDTILLLGDQTTGNSRLFAFDKKTGDLKWQRKRPTAGFNHSTPLLVAVKGKPQLLVSASNALQGLDPDDGKVLWWCAATGDVTTPVYGAGVVYCDSGRGGSGGVAVDPTGEGDVTKTHLKWKVPNVPEGFGSPVVAGDLIYRLVNPNLLRCWKAATGEQLFSERLEGVATAASPVLTGDGLIYYASGGKSYVLRPGPKLDVVAVNDLGDAGQASPAVSGGRLFLKGQRNLYCIGKK